MFKLIIFIIAQILPGLFIGSIRDSRNHEQLKANAITHILSIYETAKNGSVEVSGFTFGVVRFAVCLVSVIGTIETICFA